VVEFLLNGVRNASTDQPLASGKVYTYDAGTLTPRSLYTNQEKSSTTANPFILGADGTGQAYADGAYKFVIKDSADVTKYTYDNLFFGIDNDSSLYAGSSTGAANTYNLTIAPNISSSSDLNGMVVSFLAHQSNTGAATVSVNGLAALSIVRGNITALTGGEILQNQGMTLLLTSTRAYIIPSNTFATLPADYTPSLSAQGTTFTSTVITSARWSIDSRKLLQVGVVFTGTTGGAAAYLRFTLPNAYTAKAAVCGGCRAQSVGTSSGGYWGATASSSNIDCYLYTGSFGSGANCGVAAAIELEVN
jgi:hypothetical protein